MLHRLTLRVLPSLTLPVTEEGVRKKKRLVMLVPGLVAFVCYRLIKQTSTFSDPVAVLMFSGGFSAVTSVWAYRLGRRIPATLMWKQDGPGRLSWVIGWLGFAYGVQLSLLVLALLRVVFQYDFLRHPDGPAMMALIIACTSVARDAFEIGHVRRLQQDGKPVFTFPDGAAFRRLLIEAFGKVLRWSLIGIVLGGSMAGGAALRGGLTGGDLGQLLIVSVSGGSVALAAYLAARWSKDRWWTTIFNAGWSKLFQFWWWPGLAFAATYFLVLSGVATYVLGMEQPGLAVRVVQGGVVGGLMALYAYYLGDRRRQEDRVQQILPPSLLRCPFITGVLSKTPVRSTGDRREPMEVLAGESGRKP